MQPKYLGFLLALVGSSVFASNWTQVTVDDHDGVWFIDTDSIKTLGGGTRQAWRKVVRQPTKSDDFTESLALEYFNCSDRTRAIKTSVTYYEGGTNSTQNVPDYRLEWNPVVPDTVGETVFDFVC